MKFVITVKLGNNGAAATIRNVETGAVASMSFAGPKEDLDILLKTFEKNPAYKVKYE